MNANDNILKRVARLKELKEQQASVKASIEEIEAFLKDRVGDDDVMEYKGVTLFTFKSQNQTRFDTTGFKKVHPDLYNQFAVASERRVFKVL